MTVAEYYGPGYWNVIHTQAIEVKNSKDEDDFIMSLKRRLQAFPCKDCSDDALRYLRQNDIVKMKGVKFEETGNLIGMFYWTVLFHNYVNAKIGKPQMSFEEALNLYSSNEKCEDTCDASKYIKK